MSIYNDYEKEILDATYDFLDNYDYVQEWASDYKEIVAEDNPDYTLEDYVFWDITSDDIYDLEGVATGNNEGAYFPYTSDAKERVSAAIWDTDITRVLEYGDLFDAFFDYIKQGRADDADIVIRIAIFWELEEEIRKMIAAKMKQYL